MVLRKIFYIRWNAGRSPRVHEVNPGRDPSPHLTQAGQRGQIMGRGKGRGPHAGTSGVQGRVYTITPPANSADHPVIQGRFCYLAYGQECYLILVLRIHLSLHQL